MPQINVNSARITTFGWSVNIDVYQRKMTFNLLPFTAGPNLANIPVAFSVVDQDGVQLATIDWTAPQIPNAGTTTSWVLDLSSVNFAFLFQTYSIIGAIQDSGGTVYQTSPIYPNLCQPNNLTDQGYVPGMFSITPDCINSVLTVKEITLLVYNQLQPQSVSKTGTLNYPTGTISPLSFSNTPFTNNVVYTGQYNIQCTTVATYAIGNDVYVLVSYLTNNNFQATCANKLANVLCCIQKVQQTAIRNCNNAIGENAKKQLSDISVYVMNGLLKEISGQDASFEADYIKKYLSCDCGSDSLSQSEFTPINPAVTSIVLNGVGGTTIPSPTATGNTLTYDIASNVYQVVKGNTGDLAFTITLNTAISNTVQYIITFNYDTMAGYILAAIAADPGLQSQLNALVQAGGGIQGLNGKCIINTAETNYSLSQAFTSSTLITNIVINGTNYAAPSNLFANNPTAVAIWLNSLTLGVFTAAVNSGILTILSSGNTNSVSTLTFTSPNVVVQFQATNVTLVQVLQAIIDYLCGITSLQVALGNAVAVCTLDYNNNVVTSTYGPTSTQGVLNSALGNAICNLAGRISTLTGLTCAKLQAIFADNTNASFNNSSDRYLSLVGGACVTLTGLQQGLAFVNAVNTYPALKSAFCAIDCSIPGTCPDISAINMAVVSGNIGIYGVTFNSSTLSNQQATVKYRITGTSVFTIATNNLGLSPNGNVSGTSPYQISGLTAGATYDVFVGNNCGGSGFIGQITIPTGTIYSAVYRIDNVLGNICTDTGTTLYSKAPFGTGVIMYTNNAATIVLTGYSYIAPLTGEIFNISSSSGMVGSDTGSNCANGTAGSYILGNSTGTICSGSPVTLYTNGPFAVGGILFTDSALTTHVIGSAYVVNEANLNIYNLNTSDGTIGAATSLSCSATAQVEINNSSIDLIITGVTVNGVGISGVSFPVNPGQDVFGTTNQIGTQTVVVTLTNTTFNQAVDVSGSDHVVAGCQNVTSSGAFTYPGVIVNTSYQVIVVAGSSPC